MRILNYKKNKFETQLQVNNLIINLELYICCGQAPKIRQTCHTAEINCNFLKYSPIRAQLITFTERVVVQVASK